MHRNGSNRVEVMAFRGIFIRLLLGLVPIFGAWPALAQVSQPKKGLEIPGYTVKKVEGFTLIVHPETERHEGEFKKPPSEVLELELKLLSQILNPRALAAVKRLPFWVEWDETIDLGNGRRRSGTVIAYYLSADQFSARRLGEHPLRSKTITICNLKTLTSLHQPEVDKGQCILLHEVAHAVHDQLIGYGNPEIIAAYQQAMNRKLYEPGLYAATNSQEFFAEMTCAYLDRLDYFPRNRADLKKHDPQTFKLMEKYWSRAASAESAKSMTGTKREKPPADLSKVILGKMEPGQVVQKNPPSFENRKGQLLAMAFWHDDISSSLQDLERLKRFQDRLPEWGTEMILVTPADSNPDRSARTLREKGIQLPACAGLAGEVNLENIRPPLVIVFDPEGKAIHRGPDFASEALYKRLSLSQRFEDALETLESGSERNEWDRVRDMIKRGDEPATVLKQIAAYAKYPDPTLVDQAAIVQTALEKPLAKLLDAWEQESSDFPAQAYLKLNRLAYNYRGTDIGQKARNQADKLKEQTEVQTEIKAQQVLENLRKIDAQLSRMQSSGGILPVQATPLLGQLQNLYAQIEDKYPKSQALADGKQILQRWMPAGLGRGGSSKKKR